jgi:Tol biopolymer transport system component/DNA-binding winged helix-turn-helix (wHTH) protein
VLGSSARYVSGVQAVDTRVEGTQHWRFGVFEVNAHRSEIRRGGTSVKLREQSFRILILLLEHAGEIVTREELRQSLWPSDTYVDFDHSLNTAIMKLRDALGDSADKPLYIETIPKRGYRFIAPLSPAGDASTGAAKADRDSVTPLAAAAVEQPARRHLVGYVVGALCLFLAAIGAIVFLRSHDLARAPDSNRAAQPLRIVPITTAAGNATSPVFSPDAHAIAFVWDGPDRQRYDLYQQLIGSETPLRLTHNQSGLLGRPAWSPDGSQIAFTRCDGRTDGVYVVPALGGAERKLTEVGCLYTLPGPLVWLSGGDQILMIDHCSPGGAFGIANLSLATGEKHCLVHTSAKNSDSGFGFSLSPDGRTIAFTNTSVSLCCDLFTIPLTGGTPKHVGFSDGQVGCNTLTEFGCSGLMWLPDSKSIVFVSNRTTLPSLWRVPVNGGPVERETTYPAIGSFSKNGLGFVYSQESSSEPPAIWRVDLAVSGGSVISNKALVKTQYPEMDAQPSPDGSQIVWMSIRTGFEEIWLSDRNGEHPVQLTHLDRYSGTPRWAPDGKQIAFDSYTKSGAQIFAIDTEGRNLRQITSGSYDNAVPSWSRDGRFLYFASKRTGNWQLWKHALASGAEIQVTQHGGFTAFESSDGRTLYFTKFDQPGIWSLPTGGGAESLVVADKPRVGFWGYWAVTNNGLYLLDTEAEPRASIEFYRFATGRLSHVLTLEKKAARLQPSLSATSDGRTIYYTQYDRQSVIKMMEFAR